MNITPELIKQLREKTGAGMMDCKRALESSAGNMDAAIEYLRKKGAAVAQKRADRSAKEGMIVTRVGTNGMLGVILEVNCETDFVARSEDFISFAEAVAATIVASKPANVEKLLTLTAPGGKGITAMMDDLLSKVGEKIDVRRFVILESGNGVIASYTHMGNKIGVLVELSGLTVEAAVSGAGRDVAMQIAAMSPMVIKREQVGKELVEHELDIYRTQARNEGKPAQIVDKIASGKLEKFYQEVCLLEQTFIKDSGKTVKDYLHEATTKTGKDVNVIGFRRFHLGEEVK
jgi:elongation factor Ts